MGRNNADFHESAMYHGSNHSFHVGDVIKPFQTPRDAENRKALGLPAPTHAYATNEPKYASVYGERIYTVSPVDPKDVETEHLNPPGGRGTEDINIVLGSDSPTYAYSSKKGFKVTGEHSG
jgi:hypothetical protein